MGATDTGDDVVAGEHNAAPNETVVAATLARDARYHGGAVLAVRNLPHRAMTLGADDRDQLASRILDGLQASGHRNGAGVRADAAFGPGVVGMSGTDGVLGIADNALSSDMWNPSGAPDGTVPAPTTPLVGVRGISKGTRPDSVGVVGSADAPDAKGVVGNSAAGVGVMGVSKTGVGLWGESSESRGATLLAGAVGAPVAQLRLVPVSRGPNAMPANGRSGDLLVKRTAGDSSQVELWLCVDDESGSTGTTWAQVLLGPPLRVP